VSKEEQDVEQASEPDEPVWLTPEEEEELSAAVEEIRRGNFVDGQVLLEELRSHLPPSREQIEGYTVIYRQAEDVILAEVPDIPGCFSDGSTVEEARERVRDAILNFLEDQKESGES